MATNVPRSVLRRILAQGNVTPRLRHLSTARSRVYSSTVRGRMAATVVGAGLLAGILTFPMLSRPVHLDGQTNTSTSSDHAPDYIPYSEVQKHASRESCWVIIEGQVYDVTDFLVKHPGGAAVILKNAGKDASKVFAPIHPPGTLSQLDPSAHIGPVDPATVPAGANELTDDERRVKAAREALPPPEAALNLYDIESFAKSVLTTTAWGYYRSAGDDEYTFQENAASFKRFWFRPRVLNKISQVSTETTLLGMPSALPIYVSPSALARLGHPDGEMNIVRAAGAGGILQGISNNASCSIEEIMSAKVPEQNLMYQFYMNRDRAAFEQHLKKVEAAGFQAIMLTVDAAVAGKRELDQRAKGDVGSAGPAAGGGPSGQGLGVAHAISGYQDPDVCWDDVKWIQSMTKLPLVLKGIQCVEDAEKAYEYGVQAIVLSNHGGRELDFAPAPMTILQEIAASRPDLVRNPKFEVYLDGGVTRGTDVLKALCLGARGVGLGRAFLYANGVWGEAGCSRVIQIMREEIETGMRLLGVTSIDQLRPELVRYVNRDPEPRLPPKL